MPFPWRLRRRRSPPPRALPRHVRAAGFTLIELLAVVSIMAALLAILLPSLRGARQQARGVACQSNLRQLALANTLYAADHRDRFCPGASDFVVNLHRWHGSRDHVSQPFDSARGPLTAYLGSVRAVRDCPSFRDFQVDAFAFERGNGGYGYNNAFLGVRLRPVGAGLHEVDDDRVGVATSVIARPSDTIMFTDAAFARDRLIEYSFAEPRFHPSSGWRTDPSIHFRHRRRANAVWCDGHADAHERTFTWSSGLYLGEPDALDIGWFGQRDDNSLFDLY